jgi:hypothetical protein
MADEQDKKADVGDLTPDKDAKGGRLRSQNLQGEQNLDRRSTQNLEGDQNLDRRSSQSLEGSQNLE